MLGRGWKMHDQPGGVALTKHHPLLLLGGTYVPET